MQIKPVILVVDDVPANIHMLNALLHDSYFVRVATSGAEALRICYTQPFPDLVLLDIMMPGMDGYAVCAKLKENPLTCDIPVIFITALIEERNEAIGFDLGAVDYIAKPFSPRLLRARIHNHLLIKQQHDQLTRMIQERTQELLLTQKVTIESLAMLAESHTLSTGNHIRRTQLYIRALAQYLRIHYPSSWRIDDTRLSFLYTTAPLHDIGKVGIPDAILLKPSTLSPEEFEIVKKHSQLGYETLSRGLARLGGDSLFLQIGAEIARTHHEHWDGSGYPIGLRGESIPLSGRLMVVADTFDALVTNKVYKLAYDFSRARKIIGNGAGTLFDPLVVEAFMAMADQLKQYALELADSESEKRVLFL